MRNYNHNNTYQTSKEYYSQLLQKNPSNLNSSKNKLDFLDYHLEKLLNVTYQFFNPFFADEESAIPYKNEPINNSIDKEFDDKMNRQIPSWLHVVFGFFASVYRLLFPIKLIDSILNRIPKFILIQKINKLSIVKVLNNFFAFNSPP
jgi:hypothetical protein